MTSNEWKGLPTSSKQLIESYHDEFPVKVGEIAKKLGIKVNAATLPAHISGEIKEDDDGIVTIRVNRHDVKARQRFTIAHEIAHFLLHRHLLNTGITDDVLYRSNQSDTIEKEANNLASDILMPKKIVQLLIGKFSDEFKDDALYEKVAEELGVSIIALKIYLNKK